PAEGRRHDDAVPPGDGPGVARPPPGAHHGRQVTRLNAFLARSGVASRRAADKLISSGAVKVNGRVPPPEGLLIDPDPDEVTVDGRAIRPLPPHSSLVLT